MHLLWKHQPRHELKAAIRGLPSSLCGQGLAVPECPQASTVIPAEADTQVWAPSPAGPSGGCTNAVQEGLRLASVGGEDALLGHLRFHAQMLLMLSSTPALCLMV
eukprot:CAMPEP_0113264890 /NCGR_PEP_ID=MMETSP0008_2-20120614/19212_1 /TAXON_ID=97485 /ORGANISM="Prymnesium parvum" /LENGTH=104 /DNA_ID=CAMNT_0000113677 /DNA_START=1 /DNA_END=316 /DNA_ORIENTATION=- /assembly_acc=CAM_ASM_000153